MKVDVLLIRLAFHWITSLENEKGKKLKSSNLTLGEVLREVVLWETKLSMKVYPTGSSAGCILASLMLGNTRKALLGPQGLAWICSS